MRHPTVACTTINRVITDSAPPEGYSEPSLAWCVEYVDPRQPEAGSHQVGGFTTGVTSPTRRAWMVEDHRRLSPERRYDYRVIDADAIAAGT